MIEGSALELPEEEFKGASPTPKKKRRSSSACRRNSPLKPQQGQAQRCRFTPPSPNSSIWPTKWSPDRIEGAIYRPSKGRALRRRRRPQGRSRRRHQGEVSRRHQLRCQLRLRPSPDQGVPRRDPRQAESAATVAPPRKSARSPAKSAFSRARTVPRSSPAAKPRRFAWPRSRPATKPRTSTATPAAKSPSASSCTTTSRPSRSVKPVASAA